MMTPSQLIRLKDQMDSDFWKYFYKLRYDFRVLDLYCGAGGMGSGIKQFFDVSYAVDTNEHAIATYSYNHHFTIPKKMRVEDFIHSNVIRKDYEVLIGSTMSPARKIGMAGGPPCQEFSRRNQHPKPKSERVSQLNIYLDAIKTVQPEFAILTSEPSEIGLNDTYRKEVQTMPAGEWVSRPGKKYSDRLSFGELAAAQGFPKVTFFLLGKLSFF